MGRHLVVCTDGTWNTPDRRDRGRIVPSNVVKVARAVAGFNTSGVEQRVYYDTGIGTGDCWDRIKGGAFGFGLSQNVKQAYVALGKIFESGDKIFLFGFSRGAYTARSLAGLIGLCGIPDSRKGNIATITTRAFRIYRLSPRSPDRPKQAAQHIKTYSHAENGCPLNKIHFIGVCRISYFLGHLVGALGNPVRVVQDIQPAPLPVPRHGAGRPYRESVPRAGDRRTPPTVQTDAMAGRRPTHETGRGAVLVPGVHTNIGGGYIDHGLSDRAFLWMCLKARGAGLGFKADYMNLRVTPDYHGELRNSRVGFFRLLPAKTRVIGGNNAAGEAIHYSAEQRFNHATETQLPGGARKEEPGGRPWRMPGTYHGRAWRLH